MARPKSPFGKTIFFRPYLEDEAKLDALPGTRGEKIRDLVHEALHDA